VIPFEILFSIKSTSTDVCAPEMQNYNQYKGHDKPEIFKVEAFQVTRQIKALNSEIVKLNDSLNKKSINISKYFFHDNSYSSVVLVKYTVYCFIILMSQADVFTFFTC
jgi:Holliday junction resolvasome RuvABC endonuclease subunit